MERKRLWETIMEEGKPWAKEVNLIQLLCDELDDRLADLKPPETKEEPKPAPRPVLFAGDVVRCAGWSRLDMLVENLRDDLWRSLSFSGREVYTNIPHVVEVYRLGKLVWKLPEPEGGYRDE